MKKRGFLLINLGTPKSLSYIDLYRFLAEFLSDWRVIDLPAVLRYPLVYGLIAPFRPWKIRQGYQKIWNTQSPLLEHSLNLLEAIKKKTQAPMALGMTYQEPSIKNALAELISQGCDEIVAIPLFPQYATASTGASLGALYEAAASLRDPPALDVIRDFHLDEGYISTQASLISQYVPQRCELLVFSFHGVPVRQLIRSGCHGAADCQQQECPLNSPTNCYRSQCFNTARAIVEKLKWKGRFTVVFQSRLGSIPWIKPYLDQSLEGWAREGIKDLFIASASFTADCLETLEEINVEIRDEWKNLTQNQGTLTTAPCLNSNEIWVETLSRWIEKMRVHNREL